MLDCYGSISPKEMKLWAKDMKTWTKDAADQQYNKWLYTQAPPQVLRGFNWIFVLIFKKSTCPFKQLVVLELSLKEEPCFVVSRQEVAKQGTWALWRIICHLQTSISRVHSQYFKVWGAGLQELTDTTWNCICLTGKLLMSP